MAAVEPSSLTVTEAAHRIREGSLRATELVESCLSRIERLEPGLKAWVTVDGDGALRAARQADEEAGRSGFRGPLHGIPVGIKDIFYTASMRTTAGARLLAGFVPAYDAAAVARLKAAGAIILGKTVSTEFAFLDPAETRNPWNRDHTPGGSSSGSAAAVAARMCPLALGSQTGGSTIRPAAYCGIVGFKPTYGRISCYGVVPLAQSMDHVGILARSVADAALGLQVLAGHDSRDPASAEAPVADYVGAVTRASAPPTIGMLKGIFRDRASDETREHVERVAGRLREAGARLAEIEPPPSLAAAVDPFMTFMMVGAAASHRDSFQAHPEQYGPHIGEAVRRGLTIPAVDYVRAGQMRQQFRRDMAALLARVDALLTPAVPAPAPRGLASTGDLAFNSPWSFSGLPALGLPSGLSASGLPLGIQLVGAWLGEDRLLAVARWCEQVARFDREPPGLAE